MADLFAYDGSPEFVDNHLRADDERVASRILDQKVNKTSAAALIFARLRDRRLYKQLALIRLHLTEIEDPHVLDRLQSLGDDDIVRLEAATAEKRRCEPWEVIVVKKHVKNPVYQDPVESDPEQIFVVQRDGRVRKMGELPYLMTADLPTDQRLHIIGPRESLDSSGREENHQTKQRIDSEIRELVLEFVA